MRTSQSLAVIAAILGVVGCATDPTVTDDVGLPPAPVAELNGASDEDATVDDVDVAAALETTDEPHLEFVGESGRRYELVAVKPDDVARRLYLDVNVDGERQQFSARRLATGWELTVEPARFAYSYSYDEATSTATIYEAVPGVESMTITRRSLPGGRVFEEYDHSSAGRHAYVHPSATTPMAGFDEDYTSWFPVDSRLVVASGEIGIACTEFFDSAEFEVWCDERFGVYDDTARLPEWMDAGCHFVTGVALFKCRFGGGLANYGCGVGAGIATGCAIVRGLDILFGN